MSFFSVPFHSISELVLYLICRICVYGRNFMNVILLLLYFETCQSSIHRMKTNGPQFNQLDVNPSISQWKNWKIVSVAQVINDSQFDSNNLLTIQATKVQSRPNGKWMGQYLNIWISMQKKQQSREEEREKKTYEWTIANGISWASNGKRNRSLVN